MDYDSIPHEDIRHATYKYRVRVKDAQAFKRRMDTEPDFLSELTGLFNSGCSSEKRPPKARIVIGSKNIEEYLLLLWAALPDALPPQEAARLISVNPQRIHEQIRAGTLHGATLGGRQYCVKLEIVAYASSPKRLVQPRGEAYKALVDGYLRQKTTESES